MGDQNGFKKYERHLPEKEPPSERIRHFQEFYKPASQRLQHEQSARCMDCGVPFCHSGCPLGNRIPDFNDAVYQGEWEKAYHLLISTNNFPEFTGRICPAPCEAACVLGINNDPVSIEFIEKSIIEKAFHEGWVDANPPSMRSGKKVAVIGSGPAGLACADQLNQAGHKVTIFEKNDRPGGLLRYGIPDFKLKKEVVDRRIQLLEKSGIRFQTNTCVGSDLPARQLVDQYDAVVVCGGAEAPRDLPIEGRKLEGIHFAMEFLEQNNRRVAGDLISSKEEIDVQGKRVVVIGGGDTGSDCIGTANRLGAASILQIELMAKPPAARSEDTPWPQWPFVLRTSSSHEEGGEREWAVLTKAFVSDDDHQLSGLQVVDVKWEQDDTGKFRMQEQQDTLRIIPCDRIFLAIGFLHPPKKGMLDELGLELDTKGNVHTFGYQTSQKKIFAAGDMRRGQSLVVWAIAEGREAAREVDAFLKGRTSELPGKEVSAYAL